MKNKNIWIINQYTGSPHHGMNYRSYYLANELVKKGNSVTIFAGSYSHLFLNYPKTKGLFTKETIDDINYIWVKTPKYENSKSIKRVFNMLAFMINLSFFNIFKMKKPDIIIISSLSLFPVLNAYIWSKLLKVEFIFEVRDLWPLTLIDVGNKSAYHPLVIFLGWFEKLGYKKAKNVVSLLPTSKEYMVSKGLKEENFRYIPNGVNLQEVENYHDIPIEIKDNIPSNKFIVGYVGTIGISNALEYLLEAATKLKEYSHIHFVLVGKGGEKKRLQEYCDKHLLTNVTFIDPIPKIEVQGMLKEFDICFLGWKNEKLYKYGISANKIFDYMYSGKTILHSYSGNVDLIQMAKCGISVDAESSEQIKEAIISLSIKSQEELDKMGANGKAYVIQEHSYKNIATLYANIIK